MIEDEIVEIPELPRPEGWKSTEQRLHEYYERNKEKRKAYFAEYGKKNKIKKKKQRHDYYIRSLKRDKQVRMLRYANDPEWREQVKAYNRERMRKIRAAKRAQNNNNNREED